MKKQILVVQRMQDYIETNLEEKIGLPERFKKPNTSTYVQGVEAVATSNCGQ